MVSSFPLSFVVALGFLVSNALAANMEGSYDVRRIPTDKWTSSAEGTAFRDSKAFARSALLFLGKELFLPAAISQQVY